MCGSTCAVHISALGDPSAAALARGRLLLGELGRVGILDELAARGGGQQRG
jgi:hypothetical protein